MGVIIIITMEVVIIIMKAVIIILEAVIIISEVVIMTVEVGVAGMAGVVGIVVVAGIDERREPLGHFHLRSSHSMLGEKGRLGSRRGFKSHIAQSKGIQSIKDIIFHAPRMQEKLEALLQRDSNIHMLNLGGEPAYKTRPKESSAMHLRNHVTDASRQNSFAKFQPRKILVLRDFQDFQM